KQARSNLDSPIPNNYDFSNVSSSRNEIDLFEIFSVVFKSKFKIILITLFFLISGLVVSYILPPKWTSTAIIALPGDEQVQVLDELITNLTVL
ncbi:Wzz/FepE/Etk N-terminal domain-containing protein, partial [Yersinia pestis]